MLVNAGSEARGCAWIPRKKVKASKARDDEFENVTSGARDIWNSHKSSDEVRLE